VQAYFISDLHLKSMEERNSQKLLRFLLFLWQLPQGSVTQLCLLGDIFDLWVSDHEIFVKRWNPIIKAIESLVKKHHTQVFYFEGNHDVHIAPFWEKKLGATVLTEPLTMLLGPWVIHMAHGDLINKKDKNYLSYRNKIRSKLARWFAHNLPGGFWDWFGSKMSEASAKKSRVYRDEEKENLRVMVRNYAKEMALHDRCQFVITGHVHVQDEFEFELESAKVKSVNLGSWVDNPSRPPIYRIDDQGGSFIDL
jgi:UDP-2,3-diacylglucosamine hydrolase